MTGRPGDAPRFDRVAGPVCRERGGHELFPMSRGQGPQHMLTLGPGLCSNLIERKTTVDWLLAIGAVRTKVAPAEGQGGRCCLRSPRAWRPGQRVWARQGFRWCQALLEKHEVSPICARRGTRHTEQSKANYDKPSGQR